MNLGAFPGRPRQRRFGWAIMTSAALSLDHVAASRRYERASNKRSKSRRSRVPALANSILGLLLLVLLFVFLYGLDKLVETVSPGYMCNQDRKSTRLNSSHLGISYAVFCLKKKKI